MSLRDDVIFRVVHQMIEALLRVAGLRRKKDMPAALKATGELLEDQLGLSARVVDALEPSSLVDVLSPGGELDVQKAALLALVLETRAGLFEDMGDEPAARAALHKAAVLVEAARAHDLHNALGAVHEALAVVDAHVARGVVLALH